MLDHFRHGAKLLYTPRRTWVSINESPYSPLKLAIYTLSMSTIAIVSRSLGGWMMGVPWSALEGMLFGLICLGVTLTLGLLLIPAARFARRPVNDGHALKLALMSATPVWVLSVFQIIPVGFVRSFFILVSLAHACYLIFKGLPVIFGTEPVYTLGLSLAASAFWILSISLSIQVFLGMAFAF